MRSLSQELSAKLRGIRLLALDVDGVLTDGQIIYDSNGCETKAFYVGDGVGINAVIKSGICVAIITGRSSPMVERRAAELGITHIIQGREDKLTALIQLTNELDIPLSACAYMGDDLPDVAAIKAAGVGISVPNGCMQAQYFADHITQQSGGNGAVRELCELILMAQNKFNAWLEQYNAL